MDELHILSATFASVLVQLDTYAAQRGTELNVSIMQFVHLHWSQSGKLKSITRRWNFALRTEQTNSRLPSKTACIHPSLPFRVLLGGPPLYLHYSRADYTSDWSAPNPASPGVGPFPAATEPLSRNRDIPSAITPETPEGLACEVPSPLIVVVISVRVGFRHRPAQCTSGIETKCAICVTLVFKYKMLFKKILAHSANEILNRATEAIEL